MVIKERPADSHKGMFGTVSALVGSQTMTGAALLCCEAVMRSGAGLLKACVCEDVKSVLRVVLPEAICLSPDMLTHSGADAYVIGCGCGRDFDGLMLEVIPNLDKPAVIDADGINFLAAHKDILKNSGGKLILTPHPAEFSRLTGMTVPEIQANRAESAVAFSKEYGCITVLKGHGTVVTDGKEVYINTTGGSELAKGGSGDVLAGVIASLLAQKYAPFDAAVTAVYLHGLAGDQLRLEMGASAVLPSDVIKRIGKLLG